MIDIKMILTLLSLSLTSLILIEAGTVDWSLDACERDFEKVGCYLDLIGKQRALPNILITDRDKSMKSFSGKWVDWLNWNDYKHSMACRCAKKAREAGFRFFALQFWGECWSADTYQIEYKPASNCVGDSFGKCDDAAETECVGAKKVNYLYKLKEEETADQLQEDQEALSAQDQPAVDAEEVEAAEAAPIVAEKACNKPMDIAIAIDASGSVLPENYKRIKDLLKLFVDDFHVSESGTHFAVLHYTSKVFIDFTFADASLYNPTALKEAIDAIAYPAGATLTQLAIEYSRLKLFSEVGGARGGDIPKVLLVITDGRTYGGRKTLVIPTYTIEESGVRVIPIGVGNLIDLGELRVMNPEDGMTIESYETVETSSKKVLDKLVRLTCAHEETEAAL